MGYNERLAAEVEAIAVKMKLNDAEFRRALRTASLYKEGDIVGLDEVHTRALVASTVLTESSGGQLNATNAGGYQGRYQAGAAWLGEAGLLKGPVDQAIARAKIASGLSAKAKDWTWGIRGGQARFLRDPQNWKPGMSLAKYLASSEIQDAAFKRVSDSAARYLIKKHLVVPGKTDQNVIAGLLKARHISGLGNAEKVGRGQTRGFPADANGTTALTYYKHLANGSQFEQIFSQAVKNLAQVETPSENQPVAPEQAATTAQAQTATTAQAQSEIEALTIMVREQAAVDQLNEANTLRGLDIAAHYQAGSIAGLDQSHTRALVTSVAITFGTPQDLAGINAAGFLGRYQAGAQWLAEAGLIKGGLAAVRAAMKADGFSGPRPEWEWGKHGGLTRFLDNPANWVEGMSKNKYLGSAIIQDIAFKAVCDKTYMSLMKDGVVTSGTDPAVLSGLLKVRHYGGEALARKVAQGALKPTDTAQQYYNHLAHGSRYEKLFSKVLQEVALKTAAELGTAVSSGARNTVDRVNVVPVIRAAGFDAGLSAPDSKRALEPSAFKNTYDYMLDKYIAACRAELARQLGVLDERVERQNLLLLGIKNDEPKGLLPTFSKLYWQERYEKERAQLARFVSEQKELGGVLDGVDGSGRPLVEKIAESKLRLDHQELTRQRDAVLEGERTEHNLTLMAQADAAKRENGNSVRIR